MKGTNLGELEELIMLAVAILQEEAYGVAIQKEIEKRAGRKITISTVHSVLSRLEKKGFANSRYDGATPERGGRRKHIFQLSNSGKQTLEEARELRNSMWEAVPGFSS